MTELVYGLGTATCPWCVEKIEFVQANRAMRLIPHTWITFHPDGRAVHTQCNGSNAPITPLMVAVDTDALREILKTSPAFCPFDSDGDGNCNLCSRNSTGCPYVKT